VEPRTDNGTVILHYQLRGWNHEYQAAGMAHAQYVDLRDEEREERRAALTAYADTFRTHGWHIREYHENRDGVSVLERLIATPTHGPNETQRPPYSDRLDRSTRA
jgi:hypothetical protein